MAEVIAFPKVKAISPRPNHASQPGERVADEQSRGAAAAFLDLAANPDQLKVDGPAGRAIASVFGDS